jgi:hypothetical protein
MRNRGFGNQHEFKKIVAPSGRQPVIPAPLFKGTQRNANNEPKVAAPAIRNPFQRKQG